MSGWCLGAKIAQYTPLIFSHVYCAISAPGPHPETNVGQFQEFVRLATYPGMGNYNLDGLLLDMEWPPLLGDTALEVHHELWQVGL